MNNRKNIALFMAILENDFSNAVLEGAVRGANENDANLFVFPMDLINGEFANTEMNVFRYQYNTLDAFLSCPNIDGIVIEYGTITTSLADEEKKKFLEKVGDTPVILLSERAEGYSSICVDNESGLEEVIEHLINVHGYKKIAFLSGPENNSDARERLSVYRRVMQKYDLYCGDDYVMYGNFSIFVDKLVNDFITANPDIEAIVCANDAMALATCRVMEKLGLKPGVDIAVTGFDNIVAGYLMDPAFTTVKAEPGELSYRAVNLLCKGESKNVNELVKTKMVRRESCGCTGFELEDKWKKSLGISLNWRETAQFQIKKNEADLGLEHELGDITRELVYSCENEEDRYEEILNSLKRLLFVNGGLFLYDKPIEHKADGEWIQPEYINLVGYYSSTDLTNNFTCKNGSYRVPVSSIVPRDTDEKERRDVVVMPLFFAQYQLGYIVAGAEYNRFLYAQFIAGQISTTLYTVSVIEEQERIKRELELANKSKSQFVANMSHEIRTPINAIIGFNEMILRESHEDSISDYARDVSKAADALLMLVNDVLDFSKIEAGKMELVVMDYSLSELLESIMAMMTERAEKKGLALYLEYDKTLPKVLLGDSGRIQQILINLLSNAIKYTEEGTVTLSVSGKVSGDEVFIHFSVKDTGIGIREEDVEKLFNEFERIDVKRNRHIEGTGLGINITTGLLGLMGSKLEVQSKYGEGSVFSFNLNQKIGTEKETISEHDGIVRKDIIRPFEAPQARILVVDDNSMNRKVVSSLLKNTKIVIDQAESGKMCISMVSDNEYDVILLDHMMPEMDGIETLEEMMTKGIINTKRTPVIALTANAIVGVREMYLEKGFTDYLSKPVKPKDLEAMLISYIPSEKIIYKE